MNQKSLSPSMNNTSMSAPPFSVAEQEITEVGGGNFNLAPPLMIAMEEQEQEDYDDGVYYYESEFVDDEYDGGVNVFHIDYGDDDEGAVYYMESLHVYDGERLIVGLKVVNIEEGASVLLGGEQCAVCLEEFGVGWQPKLPCSHIFHQNCIIHWLRMSNFCPLCHSKMAELFFFFVNF